MTITAAGLGFGYRGHTVGRDVTLSFAPGEVLALLGPNGGGKTTLLKTMIGLIPPRSGAVWVDDRTIASVPAPARARLIGYVPQAHGGTFAFTAREVVMMGRSAHGTLFAKPSARDRAVVDSMLERMGVAHLADRPTTQISGGERQLVLIARALAQEPRYVVLDEPTASLDFGNQGKVMRQIRRLAGDGLGVLFTTHDPNQALGHADRVALLRDGGLMATGPAGEVLRQANLERLYGAEVRTITGAGGVTAFLPG
ncbi:ABC transporter ATP-binding protein [Phreatobacter sp.]|uniref:ABC transporter ATP-binding protein n=1 Tax=Phreatobacter sp. TaxID=1966341 RepID=UPI003F727CA4